MSTAAKPGGHGFGATPVFLAGLSTILGAIMFLRFGYAVGSLGFVSTVAMILVGHLVTIPTALALSEIATNRRVEGGGEYFIISRSFGLRIGTAIGSALYLSQAISVAFYCIALGEAFAPIASHFHDWTGVAYDPRMVSLPAMIGLAVLMMTKGAAMGVKVLYVVVCVLAVSLVCFFLGSPTENAASEFAWQSRIEGSDAFFIVFAICFPGFTGMTAGVGLSGDLARPRRSIPIGTLAATGAGFLIYIAIVWKLAASASPEELATNPLIMSDIAIWGPIIPIGLACAILSSAIGSLLVAPRTLQALCKDECLPLGRINRLFAKGVGPSNEPRTATLLTSAAAIVFIMAGDVNFVAKLISMFFMVTYGSLCAISFLEHFAANPSYRPSFRSRWYISLFGAAMCFLVMFQMDMVFAIGSIGAMIALYAITALSKQGKTNGGLALMFRGAMSQATRFMHLRLQREERGYTARQWRPSMILIDSAPFVKKSAALQLMSWLGARYGFGTYIHRIEGMLDSESFREAREVNHELVEAIQDDYPGIYAETIVSPSERSALAQALQVPGISGINNNVVVLGFDADTASVEACAVSVEFASATRKNFLLLREADPYFGRRRSIHVWLTWHDAKNSNLMLLVAYMLMGHEDWGKAELEVFAAFPANDVEAQEEEFLELLEEGRIPVGSANIHFLPVNDGESFRELVQTSSGDADLVVMGATVSRLVESGGERLMRHRQLGNVLFVVATDRIDIC